MIGNLGTALTPVVIALGIVAVVGIPVLLGKGIRRADSEAPAWPSWLADLDLGDDGADTKRSPADEAAVRQNLALVNEQPDSAFIARTRRVVVDELAQRRAGAR